MRFIIPTILAATILGGSPAMAQHAGHQASPHAPPQAAASQSYAGMEMRRVKALSEQQEADLRKGRGMGLALAAELNGYPGPMHVLEHADALRLSPDQRQTMEALRRLMAGEAQVVGARVVALEEELDALFARGEADAERLATLTAALGTLSGRLREVHLAAHIGTREAMTPDQRAAYARLRGYTAASQHR